MNGLLLAIIFGAIIGVGFTVQQEEDIRERMKAERQVRHV